MSEAALALPFPAPGWDCGTAWAARPCHPCSWVLLGPTEIWKGIVKEGVNCKVLQITRQSYCDDNWRSRRCLFQLAALKTAPAGPFTQISPLSLDMTMSRCQHLGCWAAAEKIQPAQDIPLWALWICNKIWHYYSYVFLASPLIHIIKHLWAHSALWFSISMDVQRAADCSFWRKWPC